MIRLYVYSQYLPCYLLAFGEARFGALITLVWNWRGNYHIYPIISRRIIKVKGEAYLANNLVIYAGV